MNEDRFKYNRLLWPFLALFALSFFWQAAPATAQIPTYDRSVWGSWVDADRDCWDTREEAILDAAQTHRSNRRGRNCSIREAVVFDRYTGKAESRTGRRWHADHIVSLLEAHQSGGYEWSYPRRLQFYNDPLNIVATAAEVNQSKGGLDAGEWRPPSEDSWCWFAQTVVAVKKKYGLSFDGAEVEALGEMFQTCKICRKCQKPRFEILVTRDELVCYIRALAGSGEDPAACFDELTDDIP